MGAQGPCLWGSSCSSPALPGWTVGDPIARDPTCALGGHLPMHSEKTEAPRGARRHALDVISLTHAPPVHPVRCYPQFSDSPQGRSGRAALVRPGPEPTARGLHMCGDQTTQVTELRTDMGWGQPLPLSPWSPWFSSRGLLGGYWKSQPSCFISVVPRTAASVTQVTSKETSAREGKSTAGHRL